MIVAAIDCGTNTVRLLIKDGEREVVRRSEFARLGQGVDKTGHLHADALERARVILDRYADEIRSAGVTRTRVVATSALRDAVNAELFRDLVVGSLGVVPEIIGGGEEAHLAFRGAISGPLALEEDSPFLLIDIGGGSTEFVSGTTDAEHAISVDIGAVRITERHLHSDPPELSELSAAVSDIGPVVDRALAAVPMGRTLVGVAGSVSTIAAIALGLTTYSRGALHRARISAEEVHHVTAGLAEMTHDQRLGIPLMRAGRADVIVAGALILRTVMERTAAPFVVVSEHDILDGIAASIT